MTGAASYDDFLSAVTRTVHTVSRKLIYTDAWNDILWLLDQRIQALSGQLATLPLDEAHDRERLVLLTQLQTLTGIISWIKFSALDPQEEEPTPVYVG